MNWKWLGGGGALAISAALLYTFAPVGLLGGGTSRSAVLSRKGCDVVITAPASAPGGQLKLRAGDSLALSVQGRALRCPLNTVTMFAKVGAGTDTQVVFLTPEKDIPVGSKVR